MRSIHKVAFSRVGWTSVTSSSTANDFSALFNESKYQLIVNFVDVLRMNSIHKVPFRELDGRLLPPAVTANDISALLNESKYQLIVDFVDVLRMNSIHKLAFREGRLLHPAVTANEFSALYQRVQVPINCQVQQLLPTISQRLMKNESKYQSIVKSNCHRQRFLSALSTSPNTN